MTPLVVDGLDVWRGDVCALRRVTFAVEQGDALALVGPNGAGKTTILDVLSGIVEPDDGTVTWRDASLAESAPWQRCAMGVARSFQELRLAWSLSAQENLSLALSARDHGSVWGAVLRPLKARAKKNLLVEEARSILNGHPLEQQSATPAKELSFGQQKALAVSCCFATGADLVLLDEPVSGVAGYYHEWILERIGFSKQHGVSVILAEHDLKAATTVCDRFLGIDAGTVKVQGKWQEVAEWVHRTLE